MEIGCSIYVLQYYNLVSYLIFTIFQIHEKFIYNMNRSLSIQSQSQGSYQIFAKYRTTNKLLHLDLMLQFYAH